MSPHHEPSHCRTTHVERPYGSNASWFGWIDPRETSVRWRADRTGSCSRRQRTCRRIGVRAGFVLLESLLAMAIVGIMCLGLLSVFREAAHSLTLLNDRQRQLRDADRFFTAVALWTRVDLERRLGSRQQGPYVLTISGTTPVLFDVELADARTRATLLTTTLYRPEDETCAQDRDVAFRCSR